MDQSLALNALAPFVALAKSATSSRAAADLITQATSAQNTYVFAELLQQPNVRSLQGHEQYGGHYELLKCFAWGTWEEYKATSNLPDLTDAQALKLRLLSLLTIASSSSTPSDLTYVSLCHHLDLASPIDLEHLVTQAIYSNLLAATLNPAAQTVVITSVSPLRDLAPGSIGSMMAELEAWSSRCEGVLGDLEAEIAKVRAEAAKRSAGERKTERQVRAVTDDDKKGGSGLGGMGRGGHNTRGGRKDYDEDLDDEDGMDVDGGMGAGGGKKRSAGGGGGGFSGLMKGFGSGRSGGR
ncbi:hypothetical protein LTR37_011320 [Vermiconidia calcicola]|uniref:Uncharacterized protein n=1 Tax=Vermiconidia calcicola TaxID=1690605 RepID=A0ACC3N2I2_9PEZI|nr:hypothetical protein LTR37_011320 [Vermiconidia calcicola]